MDQSGLEELMPGFNKDAVWAGIAGRTQQPARKTVNWRWVTHAGALAAGVLLAGIFLFRSPASFTGQPLQEVPGMQAVLKPAGLPAAIPDTSTTIQVAKNQPVQQHHNHRPTKLLLPEPIAPPQPHTPVAETPRQTDQSTIAVAPSQKKTPARAVHLLDVNNEDRDIALQPVPEKTEEPLAVQIIKATSGNATPRYNNSPVAGRSFIRSLAKTQNKD